MVYKFLKKRLSSEEIAKDLTQDVFFILWEKWDSVNTDNTVECRKWLITVTKHLLFRYYKKAKKDLCTGEIDEIVISYDSFESDLFSKDANFDEYEAIEKAVAELSDADRLLYQLYAVEKLSYKEISSRIGVSTQSVGMKIYRLKRKIQKISKKFLKSML